MATIKKSNKKLEIEISAQPLYRLEQSDPTLSKFVWSYEIIIVNKSDEIIQLLNRFWRIADGRGKVEEVYGAGVVGLQPLIRPARSFSYTSFCQLATPQGTMEGHYVMQDLNESHFTIQIPKFILSAPSSVMRSMRSVH